jgi:hypothetical protein
MNVGKFRKRPIEVSAVRLTKSNWDEIKEWINSSGGSACAGSGKNSIGIWTLEGDMRADVGDWIIQGIKGEFYPCKNAIFKATYDLCESLLEEGVPL